jgi:hypothetical protein
VTDEEIVTEINASAREEARAVFANLFVSQVSGKRDVPQTAVDHCASSLRLLSAFAAAVTKQISDGAKGE